jgi:hypothetical protein
VAITTYAEANIKMGSKSYRLGASFERRVSSTLDEATGHSWKRTPNSGALYIRSDLYTPFSGIAPLFIECKMRSDYRARELLISDRLIRFWSDAVGKKQVEDSLTKTSIERPTVLLVYGGEIKKTMLMFCSSSVHGNITFLDGIDFCVVRRDADTFFHMVDFTSSSVKYLIKEKDVL